MGVTGMFLSRTIGKSYSCNRSHLGVTGYPVCFGRARTELHRVIRWDVMNMLSEARPRTEAADSM